MLKNYFKIALRNLLKNKVFSLINIFGLSIGMACCMTILLYEIHISSMALAQSLNASEATHNLEDFIGRYALNEGEVIYIEENSQGALTARPVFWRSFQTLMPVSQDSFYMNFRSLRSIRFERKGGKIVGASIIGMGENGYYRKLGEQERMAAEYLFAGKTAKAIDKFLKASEPHEILLKTGGAFLVRWPSKSRIAVTFFKELAKSYPNKSEVLTYLGYAYIASGQRSKAIEVLRQAYKEDSQQALAIEALQRLKELPYECKEGGWQLPFSLDALFSEPTLAEKASVIQDWENRNLSPIGVKEVAQKTLPLAGGKATVKIISHRVHGSLHYGAFIIPEGATPNSCPIIVESKGVSWNYTPLNINNELRSIQTLGKYSDKFVYVIPSFRGETLIFNDIAYTSEGDRTDAIDGATDDALALLNVALETIPEADKNRICAFGASRGGNVALLMGIRDKRIKYVLDWTGPVDWFTLMGTEGWTQKELVEDGLCHKATPRETGGQYIERFLQKAVQGQQSLQEVRHKILASSPLYFVERLPNTQVNYGKEDEIVPVRNGYALEKAISKQRKSRQYPFEAYFHDYTGHDLEFSPAVDKSRQFLLNLLN